MGADVGHSRRLGMAAAVMLIMLIGGRIIPSFTRNWLVREQPGRLPVPFNRFDLTTIASSVIALALWIAAPDWNGTAIAMSFAGIMHFARMARWAGDRTGREPLVFILHVAYLFVPAGFILSGLAVLLPDVVLPQAGLHAFGAGAIGTMTLAVMMRATLGHTGHALTMTRGAHSVFVLALAAALLRLIAAFDLAAASRLIAVSGLAWAAAFFGFALVFGSKLLKPRRRPDS